MDFKNCNAWLFSWHKKENMKRRGWTKILQELRPGVRCWPFQNEYVLLFKETIRPLPASRFKTTKHFWIFIFVVLVPLGSYIKYVHPMELFHNDVKRGKRDVRRNLIGLKRTLLLLSQSNFVYHLGNSVWRHYEKGLLFYHPCVWVLNLPISCIPTC